MEKADHDLIIEMKTEIKNLNKEIERLEKESERFKESTTNHFNDLFTLLGQTNPKLSSKDQAAIYIAIISSIASVILAILRFNPS